MKKKRKNYVWVVELFDYFDKWSPCMACGLNKGDGRRVLSEWKNDLPDDKLRIRKYFSEE